MRLSTKKKTSADDVRRAMLAALATALDDSKQEVKKKPGLTGMRAVATGAVLYTAGRVAFKGRRFVRDRFGSDGAETDEREDEEEMVDEDEEPVAEEDEEPVAEEDEEYPEPQPEDEDEPETEAYDEPESAEDEEPRAEEDEEPQAEEDEEPQAEEDEEPQAEEDEEPQAEED